MSSQFSTGRAEILHLMNSFFFPTFFFFHAKPRWTKHGFLSPKIELLLGKLSKGNSLLSMQEVFHSRRPNGAGWRSHWRAQADRRWYHPAPPLQSAAHRIHTEELHVYTEWAGLITCLLSILLTHFLTAVLCVFSFYLWAGGSQKLSIQIPIMGWKKKQQRRQCIQLWDQ